MKRISDIFISLFVLVIFCPFSLIIAILILFDSRGPIFFSQVRVGKNSKDFKLYKFRTMKPQTENQQLLTVGVNDVRITFIGKFLRKYKLDELPQLFNVLKGEMSIVGPRPEVRKYVDMYNKEQLQVLTVKPGLTDFASIQYINENELLAQSADFENEYIQHIMPKKLELNLEYIAKQSFCVDCSIMFQTFFAIFK